MAIVALTNSSSPVTAERATADSDPYVRETQLNGLALNFDEHDHSSAKCLGVRRVQTSAAPAASGQVRANGDAWQWWGATAGAVRTALDLEGAQTVSGAKTFTSQLQVDPHLGVGVTPAAWDVAFRAAQVGNLALVGSPTNETALFLSNSYYSGGYKALLNAPGTRLDLSTGALSLATAPAVAAGAAQTFTSRLTVAQNGTVNLGVAAGQQAIGQTGIWAIEPGPGGAPATSVRLSSPSYIYVQPGAGLALSPFGDNAFACGVAANRWTVVYAVAGAINTSVAEAKEQITPLDPAACYQAAKDVRWYEFTYLPPPYTEPPEQEGQEPEDRQRQVNEGQAAYARSVLETSPARHQRGFVFPTGEARDEAGGALPPVPDLFGLEDRESTTPQADLATLGCALQEVIRRLEALEAPAP